MNRFRSLAALSLAAGVMATSFACSASSSGGSDSDATLRVALAEVTSNLDPAFYNVPANYITMSGTAGYLISHPFKEFPDPELYDGDVPVVDADKYTPELATDWKLSKDGLSLTMNLRRGVMSPYGNELTSADLVWTAKRNVALETVGDFGMTVANIDHENPVTAKGDYTVVWNLTKPSPLLLKVLCWSWFAPIDSVEAKSHATDDDPWAQDWLTENTAFFGPYTVSDFEPGQSATLSLNENYYGKKPQIETIVFETVPDSASRQQLVQRGEVDFVPDIPRSQLVSMEDSSDVQVILGPATRFSYLQYRSGVEPLDNKLVRQAISYAIPYDRILEEAYQGTSLPAKTVGTWLPNSFPETSPYTYDLEEARDLLEQAGYGGGFSVSLTYSLANPGPENEQVAVLIADALAEIGIEVDLQKPTSEAAFTTSYNEGEFEMALAGLSPGAPDSGYAIFAMAATDGFQNFGQFSDPELDKFATAAITGLDPQRRLENIKTAYELYADLVPATPIADPLVGMVTSPELSDVHLETWGFPVWKDATFEGSA